MKKSLRTVKIGVMSLLATTSTLALAQDQSSDTTSQHATTPITAVKIKELNKHPEKFTGAQVTVNGQVERIESPGAFIVKDKGFFNNKILVVVEKPKQSKTDKQQAGAAVPTLKEKEKVKLVGKVEELTVTKIEERFSPLKAKIKSEVEGTLPVLIVSPQDIKTMS